MSVHAILATVSDRPGILYGLTKVLADHRANITYVDIHAGEPHQKTYFEITLDGIALEDVLNDLRKVAGVADVVETPSLAKIYGKRIIVMGGGAQVGLVAMGAVSEADRHNIRGERISVDTIPLVGESALAEAVLSASRLPRARALVLAGALMGGEIEAAVRKVRQRGLIVVSLNMVGSVPAAADIVVTDPIQAGVMAVMAVAETARFAVRKLTKRVY